MAASGTLPQENRSRKSPVDRSGVLTLSGFGISVRMQSGHLEIEDGIGPERRKIRLARVGHGLKRLVIIGSDGFVSLAALRWLADQDASFAMLERDGSVLAMTGPVRSSDARLRRAQALAHSSGTALRIARELIRRKIAAQEQVARHKLLDSSTAGRIAEFGAEVSTADSITTIRLIESQAARMYWSLWSALPVRFPKNVLGRVPDHWTRFGFRVSPLTGSPRLAVNPPNAILNYLYSVLESEARLAAAALGLDPGLGVLHVDTPARDSLACDLMEVVRPQVDAYLLDWITRETLKRDWFVEQRDGNCRLLASLAISLSQTAPTWGRAVAPVAEWVAQTLWSTIRKPVQKDHRLPTRLTQQRRSEGRGKEFIPPKQSAPVPMNVCVGCGVTTLGGQHCSKCGREISKEKLIELAKAGRAAALKPESRKKLAETQRLHNAARKAWNNSASSTRITEETYLRQIQPRLGSITISALASTLSVSISYAADIRKARRRPHPRHWEPLAQLVGAAQGNMT